MVESEIIAAFSAKLKSLRLGKGLTMEELAASSGVSVATISKIEKHQQKPAFETVLRVARALQINFVQMVEEESGPPARYMARRVLTEPDGAVEYDGEFYKYFIHSGELKQKAMVPLVMRIKTREVPPMADWSTHEGEEFLYVLSGIVEIHTGEYTPKILRQGASCYFDSTMRHAYVSKGEQDAVILTVCLSIKPFPEMVDGEIGGKC
jgi:transcriptional regulator with XRE-family HTH domain